MSLEPVALTGLDGSTPLGFLAALGVLRVGEQLDPAPRLGWDLRDRWIPLISGFRGIEDVATMVAADAERWATSALLQGLRYPKVEKRGPKPVGALRPPVAVLRAWLKDRLSSADSEALEYAAALTFEGAQAGVAEKAVPDRSVFEQMGIALDEGTPLNRVAKGTAFDFTSRNAQFLEQVEAIREALYPSVIENALREGSPDTLDAPTLDWDPSADAPGAIYGGRSAGLHRTAEWLAFRGLVYFPVAGNGERVHTTACRGRRKDGVFIWPVWEPLVGAATVASIVRYPDLDRLTPPQLQALGIAQVFRAALTKKADGYSGMFAPSEPA